MINSVKNAWLIGLYTIDIEARIESLGYKLTKLCASLEENNTDIEKPSLIVFSDDVFSDVRSMRIAKNSFPDALLISLAGGNERPLEKGEKTSAIRLISIIKGRENRWDN
jgi:hypothetical protein